MNITSLKNRLKKLEPKQLAEHWFGELHSNDPHYNYKFSDSFLGGKICAGTWRIFGRNKGLPCCFDSGFFTNFDDGMDLIKKAFRKYTVKPCNIFHLETINNELHLNTIYCLDSSKVINKYPEGINQPTPDMLSEGTDFQNMSDVECIAFFNTVS